jgi:hypothetical protein
MCNQVFASATEDFNQIAVESGPVSCQCAAYNDIDNECREIRKKKKKEFLFNVKRKKKKKKSKKKKSVWMLR